MKPSQLEQVIKELHSEAYLWARQCCHFQDCLAKDVLQQVYLKILEGRAKYEEKSSLKTWLFSVIRYTAMENTKRQTLLYPLEEGVVDLAMTEENDPGANPEKLMMQLPEKQREVLMLVFYHDLTVEKSAEVMKIHVGTARTHYDRAKKNLKALILKENGHEQQR